MKKFFIIIFLFLTTTKIFSIFGPRTQPGMIDEPNSFSLVIKKIKRQQEKLSGLIFSLKNPSFSKKTTMLLSEKKMLFLFFSGLFFSGCIFGSLGVIAIQNIGINGIYNYSCNTLTSEINRRENIVNNDQNRILWQKLRIIHDTLKKTFDEKSKNQSFITTWKYLYTIKKNIPRIITDINSSLEKTLISNKKEDSNKTEDSSYDEHLGTDFTYINHPGSTICENCYHDAMTPANNRNISDPIPCRICRQYNIPDYENNIMLCFNAEEFLKNYNL